MEEGFTSQLNRLRLFLVMKSGFLYSSPRVQESATVWEGLRVTHKSRWWQAASIRKRGFRDVFDLQSQGVCDYMHWSFGFLHILQVIGTESIVEHKGFSHWFFYGIVWRFSEGFHGVLELNLHGISVSGGVLIYVGISALYLMEFLELGDALEPWMIWVFHCCFRWYSLVSVKGVAEGLKKIDSCGFVYVWLWESTVG